MQRRWVLSCWLRKLFTPTSPIQHQPRPTVRPRLEALEVRWLPSNFTVTDNGDDPKGPNWAT